LTIRIFFVGVIQKDRNLYCICIVFLKILDIIFVIFFFTHMKRPSNILMSYLDHKSVTKLVCFIVGIIEKISVVSYNMKVQYIYYYLYI